MTFIQRTEIIATASECCQNCLQTVLKSATLRTEDPFRTDAILHNSIYISSNILLHPNRQEARKKCKNTFQSPEPSTFNWRHLVSHT